MLIEFRVKNFLSIQDEQCLSLVANSDKVHQDSHTFSLSGTKLSLIKSAAIYGANAAGKSSLIKAIKTMKAIVLNSSKAQRNVKLPITPFLLGKSESEPSMFEATFFTQNVRYQYGFCATEERICEEWLIAYPQGRAQRWFERIYHADTQEYSWSFGALFKGAKEQWKGLTRDNALFLSVAVQFNSVQLQPLFDWFFKCQVSNPKGWDNAELVTSRICKDEAKKAKVLRYLQTADFDIEGINIDDREVTPSDLPQDMSDVVRAKILKDKARILDISFTHLSQDGKAVQLKKRHESDGTQRFFDFLGPFIDILEKGGVVFVDELHNHFHPLLTRFLISLFHNQDINANNAQLVFTTHDTTLLNQEIFRIDQIYFCEKQNKATILYPLSDFKMSKGMNLENGYFLGQFGALPYLRDISRAMEGL